MLTGLDHVTIVVHDPDQAIDAYKRLLGSAPTWVGDHAELGTRAGLFGLPNALIELVGPCEGALEAEGMRQLLAARGEGLQALAFATDDAAAASALLRHRGVRATPPEDGEARGWDGSIRRYRTVELSERTTRGVRILLVERADMEALRGARPEAPDLVRALDHVVVRTADIEAARALYGEALGLRLALERALSGRRMLFFRIGGVTVEVVEDRELGACDALWGAAYRVGDLDAAHARMQREGFALSEPRAGNKPGTRVFTVRAGTAGVPTLVLHDPAR